MAAYRKAASDAPQLLLPPLRKQLLARLAACECSATAISRSRMLAHAQQDQRVQPVLWAALAALEPPLPQLPCSVEVNMRLDLLVQGRQAATTSRNGSTVGYQRLKKLRWLQLMSRTTHCSAHH